MKKFLILLKFFWIKILIISLFLTALTGIGTFIYYSIQQFTGLENFIRQNMMAQFGMMFIVFTMVHLVTMPLMIWMQFYFIQGGGLWHLGKEKMATAKVNVKWAEVIGMDSAKQEAWELVKLLKDRSMVKMIGGKIVKGTMMIGPPGCGKTYLAKAIATECGLPIISAVGSDFVGIFVGQGAAQMKNLFRQARALAELEGGCIIFIDEIDSFARPRMADRGFGGAISHNATINQFLTEMDGLRQAENNIVVIAATNVPEDELDSAIMRAGRFDRKIYVTRPNLKEREELFRFYLSRVKADKAIDCAILSRKTLWFSPSEIESMVREASLISLREQRDIITFKDLSAAYDRVIFGSKSNLQLNEAEKEWVAYHEAGHAIIGYLLHPTDDVIKATIIPHKGSLGFVAPRPREEIHIRNREYYLAEIKVSIASYAAEKIKYGTTGSGVSGDFAKAISVARNMVWSWGMGKSGYIGDIDYLIDTDRGGGTYLSEKTRQELDEDVQDILRECLKHVVEVLNDKIDLLDYFAKELLKKQELEYDEIEAIFQKFNLKPAYRTPSGR
jgi:cell division protease FtsH